MLHRCRVVLLASLLLGVVTLAPAQVVRQITDEKTAVSGPGAMDDSGSAIWAGTSANFAGENPDRTFQIVRFDPVTGNATPITDFADGTAAIVSVSDDGEWLAFTSPSDLVGGNPDQSLELFVMRSDGTQTTQLTDDPAPNAGSVGSVALAGDGSRIAFVANTDPLGTNPGSRDQIFVIDRDGTNLVQLTQVTSGSLGALSVSDDGSRIAFGYDGDLLGSNPDLGGEVFVINADGTNPRQITVTPDGFSSSGPALSGDGQRIAFQSNGDLTGGNAIGQTEVFVVDWDGSGLRQLTATTGLLGLTGDPASQLPSITDDGSWIVYFSNQSTLFPPVNIDGNFEIFRIRNDGTSRQQLTSTILDGGSVFPIVSGDGSRITFYGIGVDITIATIDGTGGSRNDLLTFEPVFLDAPDVSPDGTLATYVRQDGLFGGGELWRVGTDGSGATRIGGAELGSPSSPAIAGDALTVVFASGGDPTGGNVDGSTELFKIGTDGTGIAQLTSGAADTTSTRPEVAAIAGIVAFDSDADLTGANADLSREIFVVGLDGTGLAQLTDGPLGSESRAPRIDAAGTWIVFESNADLDGTNADGTFEVHRVRTDGSGVEAITADALVDAGGADISGDGNRIVYASAADPLGTNPEGNLEIFAYRPDTLARTQLTANVEGDSGSAVIGGDGTWVLFSSNAPIFEDVPGRPSDLYRIRFDGGAIERIGALRRGAPAALPVGLGGGSGVAVGDDGDLAVISGLGDFTEANPDGLPELWTIDRAEPARIDVGKDTPTALAWTHESGPLRYDVVRGDVAALADDTPGTVALGTVLCIENDSPDADTIGSEDPEAPAPGQAFFYVYRGTQGLLDGPGTYGSSSDGRTRTAGGGDCAP